MANSDIKFGARYIGTLQGNASNAQTHTYIIPSTDNTAVYLGDFVTEQGIAVISALDGLYYQSVAQGTAADKITGFVVGFEPNRNYENQVYRTASTERLARVIDDPYALFEIVANGTVTATMVGRNADFVVGTASTIFGTSGMQLDVATVATTATLPLRIVGISPRVDNELGDYTILICMMNYTTFKDTTGV